MATILEYCKSFADEEEVIIGLKYLSNRGELKRSPSGYAISEKGLDIIANDASPCFNVNDLPISLSTSKTFVIGVVPS